MIYKFFRFVQGMNVHLINFPYTDKLKRKICYEILELKVISFETLRIYYIITIEVEQAMYITEIIQICSKCVVGKSVAKYFWQF